MTGSPKWKRVFSPWLILLLFFQPAHAQQTSPSAEPSSSYLGAEVSKSLLYLGDRLIHGALVIQLDESGPAKAAGIENGDVIVKIDGHDVLEPADVPRLVAEVPVGKEVPVVIIRNYGGRYGHTERPITATVKIGFIDRATPCDGLTAAVEEIGSQQLRKHQVQASIAISEQMLAKKFANWSQDDFQQAIELTRRCIKNPLIGGPLISGLMRARKAFAQLHPSETDVAKELQALYLVYMTLGYCAEHFTEFKAARDTARDLATIREIGMSIDKRDALWNQVGVLYKNKIELELRALGNSGLSKECRIAIANLPELARTSTDASPGESERPPK